MIQFGLAPADVWELTFREFMALDRYARMSERLLDMRAAMPAWVTAMVNRGKSGPAPKLQDFMPTLTQKERDEIEYVEQRNTFRSMLMKAGARSE